MKTHSAIIRPANPVSGAVRVADVAKHWRVSAPTARAILQARGATIIDMGHGYVAWTDVWRIEGVSVPLVPSEVPAYKAPLLGKYEVADRYGVEPRTARRWLSENKVPTIRLSSRLLRVRGCDLDRFDAATTGGQAMGVVKRVLRRDRRGEFGP